MLRVLAQATVITAIATLLVKLAGFGKDLCIARYFGLSADLDFFLILFSAALLLSSIVSGAAVYTLQPIIAQDKAQGDVTEAHGLAQQVLTIVVLALALFGVLVSALWSMGLRPQFPAIKPQMLLYLPWAFIPYVLINGVTSILQAVGNSHRLFFKSGLIGAATPLTTMLVLIITDSTSVWILTASILLGSLIELTLYASMLRQVGFRLVFRWPQMSPRLTELLVSSAFLSIGYVANSINIVIDQGMAVWFSEGAVATLTFASKLPALIVGVLGFAVATAFLPTISSMMVGAERESARRLIHQATLILSVLGILFALLLALPAEQLISLLFERGKFGPDEVQRVAEVLRYYALLPLAIMSGLPTNRVLVALGLSRILMFWSIGGVALNVILNLLFGHLIGLAGLALSTVVVAAVTSIGIFAVANSRLRSN